MSLPYLSLLDEYYSPQEYVIYLSPLYASPKRNTYTSSSRARSVSSMLCYQCKSARACVVCIVLSSKSRFHLRCCCSLLHWPRKNRVRGATTATKSLLAGYHQNVWLLALPAHFCCSGFFFFSSCTRKPRESSRRYVVDDAAIYFRKLQLTKEHALILQEQGRHSNRFDIWNQGIVYISNKLN